MKRMLCLSVWALSALASACIFSETHEGGVMSKVSPDLIVLHKAYLSAQRRAATFVPNNLPDARLVEIIEDRVVVDAVASGDVHTLKGDLTALGMRNAMAVGRIVSGELPILAIGTLAGLPSLQFARPAYSTTHADPLIGPR